MGGAGNEILNSIAVHVASKMMPIKGLQAEDTNLHGRPLPGKGGAYLSAALLCMWDNIHGPKILSVWSREQQNKKCEPSTVAGI